MAKRGPSHNFIKQEKERKRLKKSAMKLERRNLKKQQAADGTPVEGDENATDATVETEEVESSEAKVDTETLP